jgi:hypothetical protein
LQGIGKANAIDVGTILRGDASCDATGRGIFRGATD